MNKKNLTEICDFIQIRPDAKLFEIGSAEKKKIFKAIKDGEPVALKVTFTLSSSGRRINNRIYPPAAHRAGVDSWTKPVGKPILVNHDDDRDAIGRFTDVRWVNGDQEALDYLGDGLKLQQLKDVMERGNPKQIFKMMDDLGILNDPKWPGLGRLEATARITDGEAIKKFLDGRYLTFSQGSTTSALWCMQDGNAWHEGDICDHRPGGVDEDGVRATFLTGPLTGKEGSVVNKPADIFSSVASLQMTDSEHPADGLVFKFTDSDINEIPFSDSVVSIAEFEIVMDHEQPLGDQVELLKTEDTLSVQVLNELHQIKDYLMKLTNSEEQVAKVTDATDKGNVEGSQSTVSDAAKTPDTEVTTEVIEVKGSASVEDKNTEKPQPTEATKAFDSLASAYELFGGTKAADCTDETKRCTPTAFVVVTAEDVELAKELIGKLSVEDELKAEMTATVESKLTSEPLVVEDEALKSLREDYAQALQQVDNLKEKLAEVLSAHAKILHKEVSVSKDADGLNLLLEWFSTIDSEKTEQENQVTDSVPEKTEIKDTKALEQIQVVNDPGVASSQGKALEHNLGDFETKFITSYKQILDDEGEEAATRYFRVNRKYLPPSFDPVGLI